MDIAETLKIMRTLANGVDPATGNKLDDKSTCRQPQVLKALNRAIGALVQEEKRELRKPTNAFRSWTRAEDAQVCEEVRSGMDFHEIAKAHNRTVASILARLVKLGKITAMPPKAA
jgi:hypothetical protein